MKTSHTPGPWKLTSTPNRPLVIADSYDVAICDVSYASHPQECEANARLIAAAPELLEALQECITSEGAACFSDMQNHPERMQRRLYAIADIARAAIAKASQP